MRLPRWAPLVAITAAYVLAGKIGLQYFASVHASASPVWPPAGIALAAFLLLGPRVWPAIFAAAFVVNVTTAGSIATSLGIALGNTLEGYVAARLTTRLANGPRAFERAADVFKLAALVLAPSAAISATLGVTVLSVAGYAPWDRYGVIWLTWWLGDVAGALIVAPVLIMWSRSPRPGELTRRPLEALLVLLAVVFVAQVVFVGVGSLVTTPYPLAFLTLPALLWTAFRFGPRETAGALLLLAAIAAWGTVRGLGPFAVASPNASLLLLQAFLSTMAVTCIPVAILVWDGKAAERERAALLAREQSARAEAEERRRMAEELTGVARSFTETLDVGDVGTRVADAVLRLFNVRAAGLRLLAPDGALVGVAFAGAMRAVFHPGHVLAGGNGSVSGLAIAQGAAVWSADVFADARMRVADEIRRGMTAAGDGAVLAVPLRVKGQIIGALSVADRTARQFTAGEADTLQTFADQAAVAIDNARLYEQATRERLEADVIAALAGEINRSLDVEHVLPGVAEAAIALCRGDYSRIALGEPGSDELHFRFAAGTRAFRTDHGDLSVLPNRGLSGAVLATGRACRIDDARDAARVPSGVNRLAEAEDTRSAMIVPIHDEGRVAGLIFVGRRSVDPFSAHEEIACQRLAEHAAIAIRNSRLFEAERAARGEASAANRAKDHFLATLSHELRTPLNAIMGWLQMLRGSRLDDTQRAHALNVIERNTRLQVQLINDLLDVSRVIAGKLELQMRALDPVPVVRDAIEAIRADADGGGLTLEGRLDPATGEVLGDPGRLQQIVTNLLTNAVKFTPRGGRIEVRLARADGQVRLVVSDTGVGIAAEALPRVFDAFHQADSTSTRAHQGLGLGLAIVRQLVEAHGGRVRAESAGQGRGTTFIVELPLATAPASERVTRLPAGDAVRLDGLRVLVVDDHADGRELLGLALRERGADVRLAGSVREALDVLATAPIDALVSDLAMPGADGYDLIMAVRTAEEGRGGHIPALALTAYAGADVRERALAAGFSAHATKPLAPDELVALIASLSRP